MRQSDESRRGGTVIAFPVPTHPEIPIHAREPHSVAEDDPIEGFDGGGPGDPIIIRVQVDQPEPERSPGWLWVLIGLLFGLAIF